MGLGYSSRMAELLEGIQPLFDFLHAVWSALPTAFRWTFVIFFGIAIGFVVIKIALS